MITDVPGLRVGHWTDPVAATGCTVALFPEGTVASGEVRGGAPATRETDLLAPTRLVRRLDALLLTGGSAFGLAAADGVMRFCEERGMGVPTPGGAVPIVVGLGLFDLAVGDPTVRPGPEQGYAACEAATAGPIDLGAVGAGTGATVSHWPPPLPSPSIVGAAGGLARSAGHDGQPSGRAPGDVSVTGGGAYAAPGAAGGAGRPSGPAPGEAASTGGGAGAAARGRGSSGGAPGALASVSAGDGEPAGLTRAQGGVVSATVRSGDLVVSSLVVVNAFGVVDGDDGRASELVEAYTAAGAWPAPYGNTTIGLVATNATLDKVGCHLLAQSAHDGLARAVFPAHTRLDGDAFVAAAVGGVEADVEAVRLLAVHAVAEAIRTLPSVVPPPTA